MNIYPSKKVILGTLISFFIFSGCGLKGPLYQIPEATVGEAIVSDKIEKQQTSSSAASPAESQENNTSKLPLNDSNKQEQN